MHPPDRDGRGRKEIERLVQEGNVDFIERLFGISPDNGSGAFEILLFLAPIVAIAWIYAKRHRLRS
jgi:hypothetical protein